MNRWPIIGALVMALGLALNSVLGPFLLDAIDHGFSETIRNQAIGLDAVSLIVVAPVTVMAALATQRSFAWGPPILLAAAAYTAYMMVQYLVGPNCTVAPRVFPFQLALFIVTVLAGMGAWVAHGRQIADAGHTRALAAAMFAVAAFVVLRYLGPLLGSATEETLPDEYAENPASRCSACCRPLCWCSPDGPSGMWRVRNGRPVTTERQAKHTSAHLHDRSQLFPSFPREGCSPLFRRGRRPIRLGSPCPTHYDRVSGHCRARQHTSRRWPMAHNRFCYRCGEDVRCNEERRDIPDSDQTKLQLSCPGCDRVLASIVDDRRELLPVQNARIAG